MLTIRSREADFALLCDSELPAARRSVDMVNTITGPFRLSKKYMMDDLYIQLLKIFEEQWPRDFDGWLSAEDMTEKYMKRSLSSPEDSMECEPWDIDHYVPDPGLWYRHTLNSER